MQLGFYRINSLALRKGRNAYLQMVLRQPLKDVTVVEPVVLLTDADA